MRGVNGSLITEKSELANEFKNVFERMIINQSTLTESEENITTVWPYLEELTEEEIKHVINVFKKGKAPYEDGIAAEIMKN